MPCKGKLNGQGCTESLAKFQSADDLTLLQSAIDYLTCKAKEKMSFNDDDKEFLKELYEAFSWGGSYKGYNEAADLADYYVNGDGSRLKVNAELYNISIIVKETMQAMRLFIAEQKK